MNIKTKIITLEFVWETNVKSLTLTQQNEGAQDRYVNEILMFQKLYKTFTRSLTDFQNE